MSDIGADITALTASQAGEPYHQGNGRDQPSEVDGDGFDCSGWDKWLGDELAKLGHYDGHYPLPLGSTSTYSRAATRNGWWLDDLTLATAGDTVIYSENGDPENSDGDAGHVGRIIRKELRADGWWALTSESRGGRGVGAYWRPLRWWTRAYRIPDHQEDTFMAALTEDEQRLLFQRVDYLWRTEEEKKAPGGPFEWSGHYRKQNDIHKIASDLRDAFTGSAQRILDNFPKAGLIRGVAKLRQNVSDILAIAKETSA